MNKPINSTCNELNIPDTFRRYNAVNKGNYEYYCQDFAYSVIYGNLNLEKLNDILILLGLEKLPTILFLVRVDDFHNIYDNFPKYEVYPIKVGILNKIERYLVHRNIDCVVSNYLGRDTLGVFLCIQGDSISNTASRLFLGNLAQNLINDVAEKIQQSISIGISEFCKDINDFPKAYLQCKRAFKNNFYKGRGTFTFYDEEEKIINYLDKEDIELYKLRIIYNLDNLDLDGCYQSIYELMKFLDSAKVSSVDIKMYMVRIIDYISNYYLENGILKETIDNITLDAMKDVLNSSFLNAIEETLMKFCENLYSKVAILLSDSDKKMKLFVEECIKKQYNDSDFNLSVISNLCNYSSYYFGKIFKSLFNISFNQYLTNYRIEKSKDYILHSQLSIEEIAHKVGFSSASYFCTTFKRVTGITPSNYKN